jgi:FAD:protein FMN transferase
MNNRALRLLPPVLLIGLAVGTWALIGRRPEGPDTPPSPTPLRVIHEVVASALPDGRVKLVDRATGVMGTEVTLTLLGYDEKALRRASEAAFGRVEVLESRLSKYRPDSDVACINTSNGEAVRVHRDTWSLIQRALALGRVTDGVFDITAGPVIRLWHKRTTLPTGDEIADARALVDYRRVALAAGSDSTVTLPAGMRIDLGGIAKGTIVDEIGDVLIAHGVTDFLVNAGGDMLGHGTVGSEGGIPIALRDPRGARGARLPRGRIILEDSAVCTSGSYERFIELEGRRYSHIVDPRTGRPVTDVIVQASVVAPSCEIADALATALMVLGADAGLDLVESRPDTEALLVIGKGDPVVIRESSGFAALRGEVER